MIKYSVLFLFGVLVLFLGLTSPITLFSGPRDPVPDTQKVAHSSHCAGCHGYDASAKALVDGAGKDVNIYDDWQVSMMGLSAHDPFWRATLSHEVNVYKGAKEEIEKTCLKCHAPLGNIHSLQSGIPYSFADMLGDSLGLDGVSCGTCHQQPSLNLGNGHSGNFLMDTNRVFFGPYANPFKGPMQIYVGFEPVFSDHIYRSGICAGCHTLITETLDEEGMPTGNFFTEQATYHEWLNSVYPSQGKECQTCHLPFIEDSVVIATDFHALKKRHPFGLHQFFGANTAMLSIMRDNKEMLELPQVSSDNAWEESISNNRISLSNAANVVVTSTQVIDDTLYVELKISNKSGHKLPSGYPSRVAWIQMILTDALSGDTVYANGLMDDDGNIAGRDFPYEPHHEISKSSEDVQIYEMVMTDLHGQLTTRLNAAYEPIKDNRLLPLGFRKSHSTYDTVAIWGNALDDPQYNEASNQGADIIQYNIPLTGFAVFGDLSVRLKYHTFPSRWMDDLFSNDSIEFVAQFKAMYEGYENFAETIDEVRIEDIDLAITSTNDADIFESFKLYPNPGNGSEIMILKPPSNNSAYRYDLIDINGHIHQSGELKEKISIPDKIKPGLYYFILYQHGSIIAIKPYSVL